MTRLLTIILLAAGALLSACSMCSSGAREAFIIPDSVIQAGNVNVSDQARSEVMENISSSIEVAYLIKSIGAPFSRDYLASTSRVSVYTTSFQQALVLGILGTDLGYLNMYNKTSAVIDYLSSIKSLADAIKVGQFFDFSTLKRLASNNTNLDSLMYISQRNFNQMDKYLRENNRSSLSSLMISGAWIEGMYLSTQVAQKTKNKDLTERIGEQKLFIDNLLLLLQVYDKDPQFKALLTDFEGIKEAYEGVNIRYETGQNEMIEKDGMLIVVQKDRSIVEITDDQLKEIGTTIATVRDKIINQ